MAIRLRSPRASFAVSVWLTGVSAPWAFYLLPSRAWELALGGLLVIADVRLARVPDGWRAILGWIVHTVAVKGDTNLRDDFVRVKGDLTGGVGGPSQPPA